MTAKIIKLFDEQVAGCPHCDGDTWYIHVDGFSVSDIIALECSNPDCGYMAVKDEETNNQEAV